MQLFDTSLLVIELFMVLWYIPTFLLVLAVRRRSLNAEHAVDKSDT